MAFEDQAIYALASWKRFDAEVSDQLLRAVTAAFALVAVADGDLATSEVDRFVPLLKERSSELQPLKLERVEGLFRDVCAALLTDPSTGRQRALAYIANVAGNDVECELVRAAAEIAVAADNRELVAERVLLTEICDTLGIPAR